MIRAAKNDPTNPEEPNKIVRENHTRMPVILPEEHHDAWLSGEAGKEVLVPYPADRMKA
jgi:putative SOS response-associated peptidase YedK